MAEEWAFQFTASVSNPLPLFPVFNDALFPTGA
ncbi:Uncharacterised protein [Burkholderia pseudomallei]|nr:Uncharacterised protein [Burkholderia pseudomallei]